MKRLCLLLVGSMLLLGVVRPLLAQSLYPAWEDVYVNDYADAISAVDEDGLRSLLTDFYEETGVEMTVLTVDSWRSYGTADQTVNEFASGLFDDWGIGDATRNDGVLFLVAMDDREVVVEPGAGWDPTYDEGIQNVIDEVIIPHFRNENYSLGIYEGSRAVMAHLTGQTYESLQESESVPASTQDLDIAPVVISSEGTSGRNSGSSALPLVGAGVGGAGLLGGLVYYWQRMRRNRPRPCPQCQTMMVRLDEVGDDAFLDEGQLKEESLQSVDYDAWQCPNCQHHEIVPYQAWTSRYKNCPQCNYKALESNSRVVQQATYSSTGLRRTEQNCRHCGHQSSSDSTIPRLHRNTTSSSSSGFRSSSSSRSSSSRSSFGGGRSSGRGGRGKW
jgi:uncharacterized protein